MGAFEAKNRLSDLLNLVAGGQEVVITRKGKVAARLVGPKNGDEKAGENWMELARRVRAKTKPGRKGTRELIELGRRF